MGYILGNLSICIRAYTYWLDLWSKPEITGLYLIKYYIRRSALCVCKYWYVCMHACFSVHSKDGHCFYELHLFPHIWIQSRLPFRKTKEKTCLKLKGKKRVLAVLSVTWKRHDLYASVFGKRAHAVHSNHYIAVQYLGRKPVKSGFCKCAVCRCQKQHFIFYRKMTKTAF